MAGGNIHHLALAFHPLPPVWFKKLRQTIVCRDDNIYSTGFFSRTKLLSNEPFWLHFVVFVMCLKTSKQNLLICIFKYKIKLLSCYNECYNKLKLWSTPSFAELKVKLHRINNPYLCDLLPHLCSYVTCFLLTIHFLPCSFITQWWSFNATSSLFFPTFPFLYFFFYLKQKLRVPSKVITADLGSVFQCSWLAVSGSWVLQNPIDPDPESLLCPVKSCWTVVSVLFVSRVVVAWIVNVY